jgi:hypothetical protein
MVARASVSLKSTISVGRSSDALFGTERRRTHHPVFDSVTFHIVAQSPGEFTKFSHLGKTGECRPLGFGLARFTFVACQQ